MCAEQSLSTTAKVTHIVTTKVVSDIIVVCFNCNSDWYSGGTPAAADSLPLLAWECCHCTHRYVLYTMYSRPRNRSSRPLTIYLSQIPFNSIDRLDFWPFSQLSLTQRHGDRLDRLYTWFYTYLPRFLADSRTYATVASVAVCRRQWIVDKRCVLEQN